MFAYFKKNNQNLLWRTTLAANRTQNCKHRSQNHPCRQPQTERLTICSIIKSKTFFHCFFSSAKNSRFITSVGGGGAQVIKMVFLAREQKIRWKNVFLFLSDMKFCFIKRLSPRLR
jgi:hypothetical protein